MWVTTIIHVDSRKESFSELPPKRPDCRQMSLPVSHAQFVQTIPNSLRPSAPSIVGPVIIKVVGLSLSEDGVKTHRLLLLSVGAGKTPCSIYDPTLCPCCDICSKNKPPLWRQPPNKFSVHSRWVNRDPRGAEQEALVGANEGTPLVGRGL
ncbi:hypothetical protein CEXT_307181 [Caerostris extrusa]|uniref:Uncharacterized protein n=1 Tax=Caerostris extrusa TaxID=172846 RepID=A0AAV4TRH5_CAEEX|nr:hypothetical protein CEXT_307181 [Caerostris extrusa]